MGWNHDQIILEENTVKLYQKESLKYYISSKNSQIILVRSTVERYLQEKLSDELARRNIKMYQLQGLPIYIGKKH